MKVLIDTHILLWALLEPDKLSEKARSVLEDLSTTILISSASAWEISIKYRSGRLPGAKMVVEKYQRHLATLGATHLPVTAEHALLAGAFPNEHRDPFDRMLAAQARCEGVHLITTDSLLAEFDIPILW